MSNGERWRFQVAAISGRYRFGAATARYGSGAWDGVIYQAN